MVDSGSSAGSTRRFEGHVSRPELQVTFHTSILQRIAENADIEVARLLGVRDVKLDVVESAELRCRRLCIWFQVGISRIGLLQTAAGQRAGVDHFCVSATAYDYDAVVRKLQQIGVKVESPEVAGAAEFRDPDGLLIQVMGPR